MNTAALKRFAQQARVILKDGVQLRLQYWGFDKKGNVTEEPKQMDGGILFRGVVVDEPALFKKWNALKQAVKTHGIQHVAEESAYTWFNRLMAIRILAKNGYIRPQLEFESEHVQTPLIVSYARRGQFPQLDSDEQLLLNELLKDDSAENEQFTLLITAFCRTNKLLGRVFGRLDDYTELLLPNNILSGNGFIHLLNDNGFLSDEDYRQVELIGWLYQFYISERKDEVFKGFKDKKKAEAEDIPAATQIFTPNWIVKYMVQNTVGRLWLDLNPDSAIKERMAYLVENSDACESKPLVSEVSEIKLLDPACGSGHILVEGFDLLFEMYTEEGYSKREAVREILLRNLYGLDIDLRAAQLANFALLLKAAAKDASILEDNILPQVYAMPEPYYFSEVCVQTFLCEGRQYAETLYDTLRLMRQAQNLGSVMKMDISPEMHETLKGQLNYWEKRVKLGVIADAFVRQEFDYLLPYIRIILLLTQQYEAVAANPPYMGSGNMNGGLKEYLAKNYPDSKSDLFAVFIEVMVNFNKNRGKVGCITMESWMFLSSYEKLRKKIIDNYYIASLAHFGWHIIGIAFGTAAMILNKEKAESKLGEYSYLTIDDVDREKNSPYIFPKRDNGRFSHISQSNFEKIPGSPIAYWVSEKMHNCYNDSKLLNEICETKKGLATSNNNRFLRLWFEVEHNNIGYDYFNRENTFNSPHKWFPHNKGGRRRLWYGNNEYVINWQNDGYEIRNFRDHNGKLLSRPQNLDYIFKQAITWSKIASDAFSSRICFGGFLFDDAAAICYHSDIKTIYITLGILNSKIIKNILELINPTLNIQINDIGSVPIKQTINSGEANVKRNISISKSDWDSRETSWDFQENELIKQKKTTLEEAYQTYLQYWTEQFIQLHANEVELNRIFIDIYGLQEELTPEVKLKDITILQEELDYNALGEETEMAELHDPTCLPIKSDEVIKQFISYAIGCMMGRYRLDCTGLHIAHPNPIEEELEQYTYNDETFEIDEDAIIPLMDSACSFSDNALLRMKAFIRQVWSHKTEIENINFVESALGKDLETYLIKDFWKDHVRRYQKRQIYWLFASPKGAFQVLVYMHRMNKYTVEKIRSNYLLKYIQNLESRREMLETQSATLDRNGQRLLDKTIKDIEECRSYDLLLKNVADQQIEFDLDDGVVVNYAKFGGVVAKVK